MALLFLRFVLLAAAVVLVVSFLRGTKRRRPRVVRRADDPYAVLGLGPGATSEQVRQAYLDALAKYHPDKVSHLGQELKEVAESKTREIIEAYRALGGKV